MEIKDKNGILKYSIEEAEITLDLVKVDKKQKGTGSKLIAKLKKIAEKKNLPIGLYAEPQDDSINESDLVRFYEKNGFRQDKDSDGKLMIWRG
ncbi:MAG: GNAT family N-acetyltransferase [Leptospiraceae bacterium]|nr:GNAT family N-acetyltransferase [Leptospiraceae bacterium]